MKNAHTDAPDLHPNLILGSLHLLFWLFFHPSAWRNYIVRIDPTLQPDFTLVELSRAQWRIPALRRLLAQSYLMLPLLVGLPVGLILWIKGVPPESLVTPVAYVVAISLTLGLMLGAVISVAGGVTSGVMVGLAVGVVASLTSGDLSRIAIPTAISIAIGAAGGIASSVTSQRPASSSRSQQIDNGTHPPNTPMRTPKIWTQMGAVVIGILVGVGVVTLAQVSLTTLAGLTVGMPEEIGYHLARAIVVGASFGVAIGWRRGIRMGVAGGLVVGLVYATTIIAWKNNWSGVAIGLTSGMLFGTSFGVTMVLP